MKNTINPFYSKDQTFALHLYLLYLFKNSSPRLRITTIKPKINNINLSAYLVESPYSVSQLGLGSSTQTLQQNRRPLLQLCSTAMLESNSIQFTDSVQDLVVLWQRWLPLKFNSFTIIIKNIRHFNNKAAISYLKIPASLRSQHPFVLSSLALIPHRNKNKIIFSKPHNVSTTFVKSKILTNEQFNQWLIGFSDGESNLHIQKFESRSKRGGFNFGFRYRIKLHLDDLGVLKYIKNKLNCGNIEVSSINNCALFYISKSQNLIEKLFPIFDAFTLNTTKFLDYLVFKEIFTLTKQKKHLTLEDLNYIDQKIVECNRSRTNFLMPDSHTIIITPYWFLGLLEGEGSFSLQGQPMFRLVLREEQRPVLEHLKIFIDQLGKNLEYPDLKISRCNLYYRKARKNSKPQYEIQISDLYYLRNYFIPMLDGLTWLSKKELDYKDWKLGINVISKGLHLIKPGKDYLDYLMSNMNAGRLTTNREKKIAIKDLNFNVESYTPLYEPGTDGEIIKISNKQNITRVKYYILKPVLDLQLKGVQTRENKPKNNPVVALTVARPYGTTPLYFSSREEVLEFFGVTNRKLRWAFLNNKPLLNSNLNISYLITRIF
jgi:hypothetical protein